MKTEESAFFFVISIHAPAKGATRNGLFAKKYFMISIHAPAKGATLPDHSDGIFIEISIHAPAKGATRYTVLFSIPVWYFNPRSREGSDDLYGVIRVFARISIHAPAKGAT